MRYCVPIQFAFWPDVNHAKAETPVLWPPHAKSWRVGKDSDAGRDWGREEKGTTEDEMAGWHHWLDGRESGWTPGVGDGQGGLACCDSWGRKESDTTQQLNWTGLNPSTNSRFSYLWYVCLLTSILEFKVICAPVLQYLVVVVVSHKVVSSAFATVWTAVH